MEVSMSLTYSESNQELTEVVELPTPDQVLLVAREIRRERTGVHARIGIACNGAMLAYDTFNIGRSEERSRLSKSAYAMLPLVLKEALPLDRLKHHLDLFCLQVPTAWEEVEVEFVEYDANTVIVQPQPLLSSYIVEGGGSILFAPPGAGKSYIALLKGVALANGINHIWEIPEPRPVLFVNLERSGNSLAWRDQQVRNALGITGKSGVTYLHGRGKTISTIKRHLYSWAKARQGMGVVIIDSLSRAAEGPLGEDSTANEITNILNGIDGSWYAIGHTPRNDQGHLFGSIHWDAGADIQIKVSSERKDSELGLRLEVTKANDLAFPQPQYMAIQFNESGLIGVRTARNSEFAELASGEALSRKDRLVLYLKEVTLADATEAASATGIDRANVSRMFNQEPFVLVKKEGRKVLYGLLADDHAGRV
jgi:hypothetical protein